MPAATIDFIPDVSPDTPAPSTPKIDFVPDAAGPTLDQGDQRAELTPDFEAQISPKLRSPKVAAIPTPLISPEITQYPDLLPSLKAPTPWYQRPALEALSKPIAEVVPKVTSADLLEQEAAGRRALSAVAKPFIGEQEAEKLRDIPKGAIQYARAAAGVEQSVADAANFFTSPIGIATLGMGSLPAAAQKTVALVFAAQMAQQVPEIATQLGDELGKPPEQRDQTKIAKLITDGITSTGFTVAGTLHGLKPGAKPTPQIERTPDATRTVSQPEYQRTPPGTDVPPQPAEIRPGESEPDRSRGGVVSSPEVKAEDEAQIEKPLTPTAPAEPDQGQVAPQAEPVQALPEEPQDLLAPQREPTPALPEEQPGEVAPQPEGATAQPGEPATPEGTQTPAQAKEKLISDRITGGKIDRNNIRVTVSKDPALPPEAHYLQIDETHPTEGNVWSSNPEQLKRLGLDVPSREDLMKLPNGQYSLNDAVAKIKALEKPTTPTTPAKPLESLLNVPQGITGEQQRANIVKLLEQLETEGGRPKDLRSTEEADRLIDETEQITGKDFGAEGDEHRAAIKALREELNRIEKAKLEGKTIAQKEATIGQTQSRLQRRATTQIRNYEQGNIGISQLVDQLDDLGYMHDNAKLMAAADKFREAEIGPEAEATFLHEAKQALGFPSEAPKPKAPEKPTKTVEAADTKAQTEVTKTAKTEGERSARDIKSELVDRIQKQIESAPNAFDVGPKAKKIKISIPGDGDFTVLNTKEALGEMLARAKRLSTSEGGTGRPAKVPVGKPLADEEVNKVISAYGSAESAYRSVKRQRDALEASEPRNSQDAEDRRTQLANAEHLLDRLYQKTKGAEFSNKAEALRDRIATYKEGAKGFDKEIARVEGIKKKLPRHKAQLTDLKARRAENQLRIEQMDLEARKAELEAERHKSELEGGTAAKSIPQEGGKARMSAEDVTKAVKAKHPNARIEVIDDPNQDWNGQYTQDENGNFTGIKINSARISSPAELAHVLEHEIAHGADLQKITQDLTSHLSENEWSGILRDIAHYPTGDMPWEVRARAIQKLAEAWRGRGWFDKLVGQVQRVAEKLGFKTTRLGAERMAADGLAKAARSIEEAKGTGEALSLKSIPKPEGEPGKEPEITGIAERISKARTAAGRIGEITPGEGIDPKAAVQMGRDLLEAGVNPVEVVDKAIASGQIGNDTFPIARAHEERLAQAAVDAERRFGRNSPQYKKASQADTDWLRKVKQLQTVWAQAGHGQQGGVEIDTGTFHGLARTYKQETGKDFTPVQANAADVLADRNAQADRAAQNAQQAVVDHIDKEISQNVSQNPEQRALDAAHRTVREWAAAKAQAENKVRAADQARQTALDKMQRDRDATGKAAGEVIKDEAAAKADAENRARVLKAQQAKTAAEAERARTQAALDAASKAVREAAARAAQAETDKRVAKANRAKYVWDHIKDSDYLDPRDGNADFDDVVNKTANDLGMTPDEVRKALAVSRVGKRMMDDMYAKMAERRRIKTQALVWLRNLETPGWAKLVKSVPRAFFAMKVFGHGTVGMITHAGLNIFDPVAWGTYWPNFIKQYAFVFKKGAHEAAMQDLVRDPNFTMWKRAGLQVDPFKFSDDYQNATVRSFMNKLGGLVGNRGFDALKTFRIARANQIWNRLSLKMQTPEMAEAIADSVNHATGVVRMPFRDWTAVALFAPKLEASRWAFGIGDPVRAARIFAKGADATPAERHFAISELRQKATIAGVYMSLLAINQGLLKSMGSDQDVNMTDPTKSDFLSFKVAGHKLGIVGPLIGQVKLFATLYHDAFGQRTKLQQLTPRGRAFGEDIWQYARSKFSPFSGEVVNVLAGSDFMGRPLPFAEDRMPSGLRRRGVEAYTWPQYVGSQATPIPIEEMIQEIWADQGMTRSKAETTLRALGTLGVASTGARLSPDYENR